MGKIYQLRNPYWLADFYIFSEIEVDLSLYDKGTVTAYPYIKVNPRNKIEQIGADIRSVFCVPDIDEIIKKSSIANKAHRLAYETIDMEYWGGIVTSFVLHPKDNNFPAFIRSRNYGKSFFLKQVFDEQGKFRKNLYWIYKMESVQSFIYVEEIWKPAFIGTLLELSNSKYDLKDRYSLKNYEFNTVAYNMTGLDIKSKIKELLEQESLKK